jgi:hypothetical protein
MIAPALIFVIGWIAVLTFAVGGVGFALRGNDPSGGPFAAPPTTGRGPTHHFEFPTTETTQ